MMAPPVSIYVPSFNAERTLRDCLESILDQTVPFDQVIVIDDGSTDRTSEIATEFGVDLVRNPVNRGLAACRNTGLLTARNPLVAAVDSDCTLAPDWLETLLPQMERADVAAAGGALYESNVNSLADRWRLEHMPQNWGSVPLMNPPFLFGCNILCKREAILETGGYNETFTTNGEDVDISRRLMLSGWSLMYDPRARAFHLQQDTFLSVMNRWWRWYNAERKPVRHTDVARNLPRYLTHGLRYIRKDLVGRHGLVPLDLAFPFVQFALDLRHVMECRLQHQHEAP